MPFTNEQQAALDAQGKVIVSASAGSGKTTVMIEKIIRYIRDGVKVGDILAVTFTKKAAAQMKEKLCKALIENINDNNVTAEKRKELKERLAEVPSADISTIHSFCAKLIRSHFYVAGVDSNFRVIGSEDAEGVALKNAALDKMLENGYAAMDEDFSHLLSVYWRKKSDNALRRIFNKTYEKLRIRADYREYLAASANYSETTFDAVCADLHKHFCKKFDYYYDLAQDARNYFEGIQAKNQILLSSELCEWLEELLATRDLFDIAKLVPPKFTTNSGGKNPSPEKKEQMARLKCLKERILAAHKSATDKLLSRDEELDKFLNAGRTAKALAKYFLIFDESYSALKKERGVLDYNDLEHIALSLLNNEEVAEEVRGKYRYVFVDEYQDVNPVQEAIVSKVGGDNLFLVGDVKQSIYGFRGSKSKFFVEKQQAFASGEGLNLAMTRNFRSSDKVLDAVNEQFSLVMTPQVCDVDYARDSVMQKSGRYPVDGGRVQIHFLGKEEKEEVSERGVYSVKEHAQGGGVSQSIAAKVIMQIIQEERGKTWYNADEKAEREVKYSDIAILSRKKEGQIAETVAALSEAGLPVTAAAAVNVCAFAEVKTLMDILSLLDNAEQDIPLCSALLSAMGNVTVDELAEIRLNYKGEKYFRAACRRYAQEKADVLAQKLQAFFAYYTQLRTAAQVLSAGEILTDILSKTHMESRLLAKENGVFCLRRIRRFIEETNNPEPLSVHEFLVRLKDLDYEIEYSENGGEDSVKVLTMHSSKGLEYPIVILDNLSALFHGTDHDEVMVEEKYGIAPRAFYEKRMLRLPTVLRRLYEVKETENSVGDALNLYYVALTRAKYGLHMLFTERQAFSDVRYAKSYADLTNFEIWDKYVVEDNVVDLQKQERQALVFNPDEKLVSKIKTAFEHPYAYEGYEELLVKSSASKLMRLGDEDKDAEKMPVHDVGFGRMDERDEDEDADGSLREERKILGTAYHAFLEKFDFSRLYDESGNAVSADVLREDIEGALRDFAAQDERMELLKADKLTEILSNPVFYTLRGQRLYKEQQFLVSLPANQTYNLVGKLLPSVPNADEEEVIYQGALDLLAVGDEVRIIDYKYSSRGAETLKEHYRAQLELYRMAAAKILRIEKDKIRCTIVNIDRGFQVDID